MKAKRKQNGGLVLARKEGESITIFDKLTSKVLLVITQEKLCGSRSHLHLNAPETIGICRTEIYAKETVNE